MFLNCGVGEDSESPLHCKIKLVNPKGNQSWIFTGRTDAEVETPILWPPDTKNWLTGKDPDAGKDWRQEEKGITEDEMTGWHHQLDGHEFEQALGCGHGHLGCQGSLVCCSPWGRKELDMTERLNWTEIRKLQFLLTVDRRWPELGGDTGHHWSSQGPLLLCFVMCSSITQWKHCTPSVPHIGTFHMSLPLPLCCPEHFDAHSLLFYRNYHKYIGLVKKFVWVFP